MEIYNDYSTWIRQRFPDFRVQKISVDAGFSCPNRDGKISRGGCTFCDNRTFNPSYCDARKSVSQQLEEGKLFFSRKYPEMKYLAYFQAYSNTYAPLDRLKQLYEEALRVEDVIGLVIGTRPDCVNEELLTYLATLNPELVTLEYGIESCFDRTLQKVNRGHTFEQSRQAVIATHNAGILCGGHVILGLPGETEEMVVESARMISRLPLDFLKIHQLQIIKGTRMSEDHAVHAMELDEYIHLLAMYVSNLRPDLVIERFVSQSPADMVLAPHWGLKNHEFTHKFLTYMKEKKLFQGKFI